MKIGMLVKIKNTSSSLPCQTFADCIGTVTYTDLDWVKVKLHNPPHRPDAKTNSSEIGFFVTELEILKK